MAINEFWDWRNEFTVDEASILIAGCDPNGIHYPAETATVKSALLAAIAAGEFELEHSNSKIPRDSLVTWLAAKGKTTGYFFKPARGDSAPADLSELLAQNNKLKAELEKLRANRWPWGSYETEDLKALAAAAHEFWADFDPSYKGTAPRNQEVASWLEREHKIAKKKAGVMASILRADGLATGPRH